MTDRKLIFSILLIFQTTTIFANGFNLIKDNKAADICYSGSAQVVVSAIDMFLGDSKLVARDASAKVSSINDKTIVVGIIGEDPAFDRLVSDYKLDISDIKNKWEAFLIEPVTVDGKNCLFVIGSDPRGAAYGVLELSRLIGVSPWVWWADVVPGRKENISVNEKNIQYPSVQYRGIFINDEDWALMPWSTKTFEPTAQKGAIGPKAYAKIFELMLRLRANMVCPGMHECTIPFYMVAGNKEAAEKYGIIISTSHAEPMMRTNTGEWDSKTMGDFNYFTNKNAILSYWDKRADELKNSENIYTTGLRGIHDGRMQGVSSIDEETKTLVNVIEEQRKILGKYHPEKQLSDIPQIFVPYKEVLKAYNNGLKLPDDITLIWCDDNNGYLMRLSDAQEQKRPGGSGVYYHISYWGKPHDYLWLASTQPALIYSEMKRAWDYGARRYWLLNVGDIKPGEYLTEFFLDMAWNINLISPNTIYQHQEQWIKNTFKDIENEPISNILKQYYHLAGQRKPEHIGWNKVEDYSNRNLLIGDYNHRYGLPPVKDTEYSPFYFGDEINNRIEAYEAISLLSDTIYQKAIPENLKAAYFQLVQYPVKAATAMNKKWLYAQKARLYAKYNLPVAEEYARKATGAYNEIALLDYTYNKDLLWGKWDGMMDMKPRDLPVFQAPVFPGLKIGKEEGVYIWVENDTFPTQTKSVKLPDFTKDMEESYFFSIYPKTKMNLCVEITNKPDFIQVEEIPSDLLYEKRYQVSLATGNALSGSFQLKINGETYSVAFNVKDAASVPSKYVEKNKMIALKASDYTNSEKFENIEGLGFSGNAVKLAPVKNITNKSKSLEYTIYTESIGNAKIKIGTIFRYPANPKDDLRFAVVIDDEKPQIISVRSEFLSGKWSVDVLRNQCLTELAVNIQKKGKHTIKIYALDEELVFDQLMIDFDLNRKHYVIPTDK